MIRKKFKIIAILLLTISLSSISCSKDDIEGAIECLTEKVFVDVHHSIHIQNPSTVTFSINYSGEHKLEGNIKWDFGDGATETSSGTTIEHTYSAAGTYKAKALNVTIRDRDVHCSYEISETVVIK